MKPSATVGTGAPGTIVTGGQVGSSTSHSVQVNPASSGKVEEKAKEPEISTHSDSSSEAKVEENPTLTEGPSLPGTLRRCRQVLT